MGTKKLLLAALRGERVERVPFWFMRQAGRYLPEYRQLRAEANGFMELCLNPNLATEVTLQPLRRFNMDGAILFSDILMVPHGLGVRVWFEEGEGPKLEALDPSGRLPGFDRATFSARLAPVYETVARIAARLSAETTLIGFAGAPWTVATYMIEGGSSREFARTKSWAFQDPVAFDRLIELLVDATIEHVSAQIAAGAEAVQLFDSWASALPARAFERWSIKPTQAIVQALRTRHAGVPIIGFPRLAGAGYEAFVAQTGVDAVSLDPTVPLAWARSTLQSKVALQGNLDPQMLVVGGDPMISEAGAILESLAHGPFVFNLGHGVVPETPPEHVAQLSETVRAFRVSR